MAKRSGKSTKSKIVSAAWKLFYEQGYDATTVEEIIAESGTSKGSFYHYFEGKDALLGSLAYLFDEKYEELSGVIDETTDRVTALLFLNQQLFEMIENTIDLELMKRMYATQLLTKSEKALLNHDRMYYRLLRRIVTEGQRRGEITSAESVSEIVRYYAFCERALLYDWCLCNGEYSLRDSAVKLMPDLLKRISVKEN